MRRPLAALVLGAVSLAGLVPAAGAGAAELPKLPFFHRKPALKLGCKVVRQDDAPAVACRWSSPRRPGDTDPAPVADATPAPVADATALNADPAAATVAPDPKPAPPAITFRLRRGGGGEGRVDVYTGPQTWFTDTSVEPGGHYAYRAEIVRPDTRRTIHSRVVVVRVPADDRAPIDPVPVPEPKPRPADPTVKPVPVPRPKPTPEPAPKPADPAPKPLPVPEPKPLPVPAPKPEPVPAPVPRPKPAPEPAPAPKPAPEIARMKLACAPQRFATTDAVDAKNTDPSYAPAEAVVACEWAAPADLKVAGYQLWRAERPDGTKQVIFKSVDATRYLDRAVSSGHSYVYVVRALDANGKVIGQSDGVLVSFPPTMTTNAGAAA